MTKLFKQLLLIGALSFAAIEFVCGQDAASAPFQSRPTSPEPTVAPEVEATPIPTPTATPQPERVEPSTPAATPKKSSKPAATHKPAAKPSAPRKSDDDEDDAASRGPGGGVIGAKLHGLEDKWEQSIVDHDAAVIDELVADDFIGTGSTGKLGGKGALIAEAKRDKNVYKTAVARHLGVRVYGSHVAIVTGIAKETGKDPDGKPFEHSYRFTDTWMDRDGHWQCIASHAMIVPKR